ncbi:NAD(P)/FAD-dependent oxidoreductase [Devosia submarina]|uniref:NAD(P)/FAD-dependent oxidoreductase n=1 Tax=Devosia submarina TaxID=1173082 RepID=UPI000D3BC00D|nr:FAD-dependent oxidoreductase [Devosia submarina]
MRRVVILGGGYAGLHAFSALRSRLRASLARNEVELLLVSRDGYHTYHGWTGEVLNGDLPVNSTLTPLQPILGLSFLQGEVVSADLSGNTLTVVTEEGEHQELAFDHLVIAAGSTDPFDRIPGLGEHGWCVKDTRDMQKLVGHLQSWDTAATRTRNVVVVGGGLAGVESASALAARFGKNRAGKVNIHLVSSSEKLLPSLRPSFNHIADTATRTLTEQGVQLHHNARAAEIFEDHVELADGKTLSADLTIVAAGVSFRTLAGTQSLPRNAAGQIIAGNDLRVGGRDNIWVAGDIAAVSHPVTGEPCPANALWAMKQGDCVGSNIARVLKGRPAKRFNFRGLGQSAGLAGQRGITELFTLQFTGRLAWVIRVLFFAWYMPSRRRAFPIVSHLSRQLWTATIGPVFEGTRTPAQTADVAPVANLSSRAR